MLLNNKTVSPKLIANRIKIINSFLRRQTLCNGFPINIALEITNRCNADCIMCSRGKMKRPIGDMDLELFQKIINEVSKYTELIWLHLAGEPLLHPSLYEMIAYAKSKNINLGLSTNAIALDEQNALKIISSGLDLLIISFDGASKATYEKIRRLSNYEKTLSNILRYLDHKSRSPKAPHTQMQFICMNENKDEMREFLEMWRNSSAEWIRFKPYFKFPDSTIDQGQFLEANNCIKRDPCFLLWRQCSIYWDGTVVSCCWDFLEQTPLGNVRDKSIVEIWNSKKMQWLRQKHIEGEYKQIELCRNCNVPSIGIPFLLGSIFLDDLTVRKLLPMFDNLSSINKMKGLRYYK